MNKKNRLFQTCSFIVLSPYVFSNTFILRNFLHLSFCIDLPEIKLIKERKKKITPPSNSQGTDNKYLHNLVNPIHTRLGQDFLLCLHGFPLLLNEVPYYLAKNIKRRTKIQGSFIIRKLKIYIQK